MAGVRAGTALAALGSVPPWKLSFALGLVLTGCDAGGSSAPDATPPPDAQPLRTCSPEEVDTDILKPSCAFARCHAGPEPAADLDYTTDTPMLDMIDVPSACGGEVLVVPGRPTESYLLEKVQADPRCGAQMPLDFSLSAEELSCIATAIDDLD